MLILVSDHSMDTTSSKVSLTQALADAGVPESEFVALNDRGSIDFVYLADRTSPGRFELLARMRAVALAQPGVAEVLYREPNPPTAARAHTVESAHPEWHSLGDRAQGTCSWSREPGVGFGEPSPAGQPVARQPWRSADCRQLPRGNRRQQPGAYRGRSPERARPRTR